jgi:hypothetical protein
MYLYLCINRYKKINSEEVTRNNGRWSETEERRLVLSVAGHVRLPAAQQNEPISATISNESSNSIPVENVRNLNDETAFPWSSISRHVAGRYL